MTSRDVIELPSSAPPAMQRRAAWEDRGGLAVGPERSRADVRGWGQPAAPFLPAPRGQKANRKVVRRTIHEEIEEDAAESFAEEPSRPPWLIVLGYVFLLAGCYLVFGAAVVIFGPPGAGGDFAVLIALAGGLVALGIDRALRRVRGY